MKTIIILILSLIAGIMPRFLNSAGYCAEVQFEVPISGKVSVGIYSKDGVLVRQIIIGESKEPGKYTLSWDELDDEGNAVEPTSCQWRGVIVPQDYRIIYDGAIGNKGIPSYSAIDDYKRIEHRAGEWVDVAVDEGNNIYWISCGGEGDPLMQKVSPEGAVIWGAQGGFAAPFTTLGWAVAVDRDADGNSVIEGEEGNVYILQPGETKENPDGTRQISNFICRLNSETGKLRVFKNGPINIKYIQTPFGPAYTQQDLQTIAHNGQIFARMAFYQVRKIEAKKGKLYVPLYYENRIDIYDDISAQLVTSINNVEKPQDIAIGRDDKIYVLSDKTVKRYSLAGEFEQTIVDNLDQAWSFTLDSAGNIYVTDLGGLQQVKIFSKAGNLIQTIGIKGGGFDFGKVSSDKLVFPLGIAVDKEGNIIVADFGNNRIQKYDRDGKEILSIISGIYFDAVFPDEENPEILWDYGSNCFRQYHADLENKTWELERFWNLPFYECNNERFKHCFIGGEGCTAHYLRYLNGNPYIFICTHAGVILRIEGDNLLPVAALGGGKTELWEEGKGWALKTFNKFWSWSDLDRDGLIEESELTFYDNGYKLSGVAHGNYVDYQGTMYLRDIGCDHQSKVVKFLIAGFNKNGDPYFSWDKAEKIWEFPQEYWEESYGTTGCNVDASGNVYVTCIKKDWSTDFTTANVQVVNVMKYDKTNKRLWKVGRKMGAQKDAPGELGLPTFFAGIQDSLVYVGDVTGQLDVWTDDGLYVATLLEDGNTNPNPPSYYRSRGEQWIGYLFKDKDTGKIYYYTAPNAMCAIRRYEIKGVDSLERISGDLVFVINGDINDDGQVNVLDVQLCVNVVLGIETDADRVKRANVNGDGSVDVLDLQTVVNEILNSG